MATSQKKSSTKTSIKYYQKGTQWAEARDYDKAREAFLKAIKSDPTYFDAFVQLGAIAFELKDWAASESNFSKALEINPDKNPMVYFKMGEIHWQQNAYSKALQFFSNFSKFDKVHPRIKEKTLKYIRDLQFILTAIPHPDINEQRLPPAINSSLPEYLPSLTADESKMVFTRRVNGQEDFYISHKTDSSWQVSFPITDLNTPQNEGAHCLSADGKLLIFTACNRRDGLGSCDLYFSTFNGSAWSSPQNLGSTINSPGWDSQPSLSPSSRYLYFSSERSGGAGGRDIWVTKRNASGWDPPQNIRDVNTPYNEEAPFIHADDATLYFMSNGWPGYGGTDLFMSKNKKDQWSQPVNLGAPVNSKSGEGALYINVAGKTGYFARTVEDQIDIFSFEIPEKIKPDPATYVKWMVRHRVTDAPLQAIVTITDLKAKKVIRKVKTSTKGEMLVCLPMGIDYAFTVEKERFAFYSQNHNLTELATLIEPAEFTAFLEPITETGREKASDPVVLNNVFFVFGEADILDKSQPELDKLVLLLKENPQINIRIQGHTDNIGSDQSNLQLSQDRARSIYQFLIEKGINPARLEYEGYGATHPIADNDTEAGRQQNRRSEFVILKHDR